MKELQTYGKIQAGTLRITRRGDLLEALRSWPDCRIILTVRKLYNRRSNEQNAYLHGVVFPEIRRGLIDNGYRASECEPGDVKRLLKSMFAKKELINEKTGEILTTIQPTHTMTTVELMVFIEACRAFSSEYLSRYIPAPNEQTEIF